MSLSRPELERFTVALATNPERWEHLVRHRAGARVYERLWDDGQLNAWLICWSSEHDTGFHDHECSAAAIAVIEGQVREERLRLLEPPRSQVLGPGARAYVPPAAIHRVVHWGSAPAVTIHAYSPPLRKTGAYSIGPGGELERTLLCEGEELRPLAPAERPESVPLGAAL